MNNNWIEEKKHHFSWEPKPYWRYHKIIVHSDELLEKILQYNVRKAHIDKFDEEGECCNKIITKKDSKCGKYLKGKETESVKVDAKIDKVTIIEKDQWNDHVAIDRIVFHNISKQKCKKASELQRKIKRQETWEMNELGNWFGFGKKVNFTKNIGLPKKIKDELRSCKKLLVDNFGDSRIHFPHDHKCHRIREEAEHLINIDNLKNCKKIANIVKSDFPIDKHIREYLVEIKKLKKKQWKTGVPVYET